MRSCKPGDAISIIETDCQVDFEAPKDYKEPQYTPSATASAGLAAAVQSTAQPSAGTDGAAAAPEESSEPAFVPFVGCGRRLDGKSFTRSSEGHMPTSATAAATAAAGRAAAGANKPAGSSSGGSSAVGGSKPGTFVSTGNRLADKLAMDKVSSCDLPDVGMLPWAGSVA